MAPTEAGERLLQTIGPRLEEIHVELASLSALRDRPAGTIRLTSTENAASAVLWPALQRFLPDYPDVKVEIVIDYGLTDIVAERFDAGVRPGGMVTKDMIAVPIAPDMRMAVVGAPSYFADRSPPRTPRDLTEHNCVNLRLPSHGGVYAWEFEKNGRELRVRAEGQLMFNAAALMIDANSGRLRADVPNRTTGATLPRRWTARSCIGRLVPSLLGLPSLLPKPAAAYAGLCLVSERPAVQRRAEILRFAREAIADSPLFTHCRHPLRRLRTAASSRWPSQGAPSV